MVEYVAGLYFDRDGRKVAMVEKLNPAWQKGKYNAIGGKIEHGEEPLDAMVREFQEETGIYNESWKEFAVLYGSDWKVHFFVAFGYPYECKTVEQERIFVDSVDSFLKSDKLITNLKFLIPLALDDSGIQFPVYLNDLS